MPLEDGADIVKGLQKRGLTSVMSGLDNLRNMVGSPLAGIDPYETYDTRPLTKQIDDWYSGNGYGNPEWANLPRKFNIAISGSRDDFAHTHINDIGLVAIPHSSTGEMGFNVVLGGYFSIKRAAGAIPMDVWIPESKAFDLCRAILRIFRDMGSQNDRQKTRLMWLIEEMGMEKLKQTVLDEMNSYAASKGGDGVTFSAPQNYSTEWIMDHRDVVGVHQQKQPGLKWVGVHVPVGRLSAAECRMIADVADRYSQGEIRFTVEQNFLFPNVPQDKVNDLLNEPLLTTGRFSVSPGHLHGRVVSCTGAQFCPVAIVETKLNIDQLTRKLEQRIEVPHPIRIHITGCPNSCGQVQLADIGLMGAPAKKANAEGVMKAVPGVNVFVGGKIGEHAFLQQEPMYKGIPISDDDLLPILEEILITKFSGKKK